MSTRKIEDFDDLPYICPDGEHNPPKMMLFTPGVYEHSCPNCGMTQTFVVYPTPTLESR